MFFPVRIDGKEFFPAGSRGWSTTVTGMDKLVTANRISAQGNRLAFVRYFDDFPVFSMGNNWTDTGGASDRMYVVQTADKVIQRCLLMTTDPGDMVLDPTCGSGTTAYRRRTIRQTLDYHRHQPYRPQHSQNPPDDRGISLLPSIQQCRR